MSQNKKVVKYKKPFQLNIGILIFVIVFIYFIFNIYSYLTTTHISVYEVGQGTIAENNIYHGLILREEYVYRSPYAGALNFYVKEAGKVSKDNLVYSVDESGDVSRRIAEAGRESLILNADNLEEISEAISDFQFAYNAQNFYQVYAFQENLNSTLDEAFQLNALNSISEYAAGASDTFHRITSDIPGIVVYYTDGYENVTVDEIEPDMFYLPAYKKTSSKQTSSIAVGEPVYKLITSEKWNIVIPIEHELATELAEEDTIQIRFAKDDKKTYATYEILSKDDFDYLVLTLKSSMIRYARERFVEVELMLAEETGLKIPNSAITEKEFYTIPKEYFTKGGDSTRDGLIRERRDEKGQVHTEFVLPTIYYETEDFYYIDSENVLANDLILKPDSKDTYRVATDTALLQGVYNINKGYAVFKQINILYQSKEYAIVERGTRYGIALYDHIALDGTAIAEHELVK